MLVMMVCQARTIKDRPRSRLWRTGPDCTPPWAARACMRSPAAVRAGQAQRGGQGGAPDPAAGRAGAGAQRAHPGPGRQVGVHSGERHALSAPAGFTPLCPPTTTTTHTRPHHGARGPGRFLTCPYPNSLLQLWRALRAPCSAATELPIQLDLAACRQHALPTLPRARQMHACPLHLCMQNKPLISKVVLVQANGWTESLLASKKVSPSSAWPAWCWQL